MQNNECATALYHATAYVRLSKEDAELSKGRNVESNSISNQKQLILDFLENKPDIEVVSIRVDDGYTGTNYDRPAFQLMLEDIKAGKINCVVVKDLSRFGREYIDAGKYIDRIFPYYGVRLISINDGIDTITKDAADEFGITVKNLFNDNYCRDISIKIRSNLKTKRNHGEFLGAFTPYGYKRSGTEKNKLIVDEYPASIVQDIFKWMLNGMNPDGIAKKLNDQGILAPTEYKLSQGMNYKNGYKTKKEAKWSSVTVRRILTNEVYVGTLIQGVRTTPNYKVKVVTYNERKDWSVLEEDHEALISERTFRLVQRLLLLDTRTAPSESAVYPLAGMLKCGDCGSAMVKKVTSSHGKKYNYYVCSKNKQHHTCSSHRIKVGELQNAVLVALQNQVQTIIAMDQCLEFIGNLPYRKVNLKKAEEKMQKLEEEISRFRKLKISLYEDMKDGIVSKRDYMDIGAEYDERIRKSEQAVKQVQCEMDKLLSGTTEQQLWMKDFIKHKNISSLSREVVVELIDEVLVYEGKKIEVVFFHREQFDQLRKDIESFNNNTKEEAI